MASDPIGAVLSREFRGPFRLIIAFVVIAGMFFTGMGFAERFVDARIDLRVQEQTRVVGDHENRLGKIESRLGAMGDTLSEIRTDMKVVVTKMDTVEQQVTRGRR